MNHESLQIPRSIYCFSPVLAAVFAFSLLTLSIQAQTSVQNHNEPDWSDKPYETLFLTNITQKNEANDIQTDLRNLLPGARIYFVPAQSAISFRGTPEELKVAKKLVSDLDRVQKTYRLTYTITETDGGRRVGVQHFSLIVVAGQDTQLKQGSKVPIVTGEMRPENATQSSQVQYLDIGLNIDASINGYLNGATLRTKIEQSSLAEEKSGVGVQDPVIRQAVFEGSATLVQGKPLILGSLDIPGTTRHQEIEVVSEQIR